MVLVVSFTWALSFSLWWQTIVVRSTADAIFLYDKIELFLLGKYYFLDKI
jgi:hypothetical protein